MRILILALITSITITAGSVSAGVVGDLNDDGRIDIFDILSLLKVISNKGPMGNAGMRYVLEGEQGNLLGGALPADTILGVPMVRVPAGSFVMGGTVSPQHSHGNWPMHMGGASMHAVGIDSFWVSTIEITRELYEDMMGVDPSLFTFSDSLPVHGLSWFDAVRFCNALSTTAGLEVCYDTTTWQADFTANGFRLPTEAEWEYAGRAGSATMFYSGNDEEDLQGAGWYDANSEGTLHPVGGMLPNGWGLYDMMGNAWEWCNDWYGEQFYGADYMQQPSGPQDGTYRVVRGGAYNSVYSYCSPAYRFYEDPAGAQQAVGLRVVRSATGN